MQGLNIIMMLAVDAMFHTTLVFREQLGEARRENGVVGIGGDPSGIKSLSITIKVQGKTIMSLETALDQVSKRARHFAVEHLVSSVPHVEVHGERGAGGT